MARLRPWLPALVLFLLAPGLAPCARADLGPIALDDSTVFESFKLPNGLRVVTRDVPGCRYVDVTVAYDFGQNDEPQGKEGMSALLAELEFYAATAETPERTREEMPSLRPAGWDVAVVPRVTRFSEIAPENLLPGLVHQAADRMRGVHVTPAALKRATNAVRADLDSAYRLNLGLALHHAARAWGTRGGEAAFGRAATGRGIQGIGVREIQQQTSAVFVPANAVLSVAGSLGTIPLRALIQSEFGSIPAGAPVRHVGPTSLDSTVRTVPRPEASRPMGVLGLIAPSLDDSTHAAFYLQLALVGAHCSRSWGRPDSPLTSRFHYSIFDDPEMARFYPPVGPAETDPELQRISYVKALQELGAKIMTPNSYIALWRGLDWLLGGPLPPEIFERVLREPGVLHTLATGAAVRELWGGEPFWSEYRGRFRWAVAMRYPDWDTRMTDPKYLVNLLFVPGRTASR